MVSENLLWNTEASNDMVENEENYSFLISVKGGHCLYPFNKIIDIDNDIFVPPSRN